MSISISTFRFKIQNIWENSASDMQIVCGKCEYYYVIMIVRGTKVVESLDLNLHLRKVKYNFGMIVLISLRKILIKLLKETSWRLVHRNNS